jgi:tetratricopeptide (TPR) repeat protein
VQRRNWLGWIRALQGNRTAAGNFATGLLQAAVWPINVRDLRGAGVMLAEIGEVALAEQVLERLERFVRNGYDGHDGLKGAVFTSAVEQIKGEIERARGEKESARRHLEKSSQLWVDVLMLWSLARVSEDLGNFQSARTYYREILNREGEIIRSHFPGLKSLALSGAARCEVALGNREQAKKDYDEFFKTLGKHSPELMVVTAARQQLESLRSN